MLLADPQTFQAERSQELLLISLLFLVAIIAMAFLFASGWWLTRRRDSLCPYTGAPLRRGDTLSYYAKEQILHFLYEHQNFDNRMFKLNKAAFCRDTGRIFPEVITWYDTILVDWDFLQKRCKGNFVSWGSLTLQQQEAVRRAHGSLAGFQTDLSSSKPAPRDIEPEYVFIKPGPLYVDVNTMVVMGWKAVPATEFEVLVVQRPVTYITPGHS